MTARTTRAIKGVLYIRLTGAVDNTYAQKVTVDQIIEKLS